MQDAGLGDFAAILGPKMKVKITLQFFVRPMT